MRVTQTYRCASFPLVGLLVIFVASSVWAAGETSYVPPGPGHNNVAALYCITLGYRSTVQEGEFPGQIGLCHFPDGTSCPEWDFYAGTCGASFSLCAQRQLEQHDKTDGNDTYAAQYTACVVDGVEVSVSDMLGFPQRFNTTIGPIDNPPGFALNLLPALSGGAERIEPPLAPTVLPAAFTWRNKDGQNWVTSVKDQSQCGSCWDFSAIGATEAAFNIARNNPNFNLDLSEEILNGGSAGSCCGGWHYKALDIIKNTGVADESCLPYDVPYYATGACDCFGNPPCNASCAGLPTECSHLLASAACSDEATRRTTIADYVAVVNDIDTIKSRLMDHGPLSICYAHQGRWNGSVYECPYGWCRSATTSTSTACSAPGDPVCPSGTSCQAVQMNHCVDLVGYDDNGGNGFWIIKNSWGTGFNGDGFFNLRYDQCLVQTAVYYVDAGTTPNRAPTAEADGPYAYECQGATTAVALDGTGSHDPDGDTLTYAWTSTCASSTFSDATLASPTLTVPTVSLASPLVCGVDLTVKDPSNASDSDTASVTISDTTPPTITCPPEQTAECTGPTGAAVTFPAPTASDLCTSSPSTGCSPTSGSTFPLGTTSDTCTATDASTNASSCSFNVKVVDTTPPVITTVAASPRTLWPPNHKMVAIAVAASATDVCGTPVCHVSSVASNEPDNGTGDGNTSPDWTITGPLSVRLRAERAGTGTGRVYTITVTCSDPSGNSSSAPVTVSVSHNQ